MGMVVAPLSANSLAKMASGLCDNLLLSTIRAWDTTGFLDLVRELPRQPPESVETALKLARKKRTGVRRRPLLWHSDEHGYVKASDYEVAY